MLKDIIGEFPQRVGKYYEPFLGGGGGAVFFAFHDRIRKAYLSDTDKDLVNAYKAIKKDVEAVIGLLDRYENGEHLSMPVADDSVGNAARYIHRQMVKRGYSHEGWPEMLRSCSRTLKRATVRVCSHKAIKPEFGDFVYCDTCNLEGLGYSGHVEIEETARQWRKNRAAVLISTPDTAELRGLYKGWNIRATPHIFRQGKELLVSGDNWELGYLDEGFTRPHKSLRKTQRPDRWMLFRCEETSPYHRILSTWNNGKWDMSLGIYRATEDGDSYVFATYDGHDVRCKKGGYGTTDAGWLSVDWQTVKKNRGYGMVLVKDEPGDILNVPGLCDITD